MLKIAVPPRDSKAWKTPMFDQYWRIKEKISDALLFYRMGDFYELFGEDAVRAAPLLEVQLTARNKGAEEAVPMCGVPFHAWESYAEKILAAGLKIALCEQLSDPNAAGSKLVERGVVRILTPGLPIQSDRLAAKEPHWFLSMSRDSKNSYHLLAYDFLGQELFEAQTREIDELHDLLARLDPKEILLPSEIVSDEKLCDSLFPPEKPWSRKITPWAGHDARENLLAYLRYTQRGAPEVAERLLPEAQNLWLLAGRRVPGLARLPSEVLEQWAVFPELFELLDRCGSVLGSRKIRSLLAAPLTDSARIRGRQDALLSFKNFEEVLAVTKNVYDFERLLGRFRVGAAAPRELLRLLTSLHAIDESLALSPISTPPWQQLFADEGLGAPADFNRCQEKVRALREKLARCLEVDCDPGRATKLSELLRRGFNADFDELRLMSEDGESWLSDFEKKLQEESSISSLKLRYNRVFGYYIEVTKAHLAKVPDYFERKQTTVGGERFTCPELRQKESEILSASVRLENRAKEILEDLQREVLALDGALRTYLAHFAWVDAAAGVLKAFAELRRFGPWSRPEVSAGAFSFSIENARHPVIEALSLGGFVPNSLALGRPSGAASGTPESDRRILLLTGPNMAGKSTFMRQMGLCLLLAQCGFWVPAEKMQFCPASGFFSRMGATDRILQGESTFMVEMKESALILREADENSFVLIDEIGRGTSTEDGLSIARAVLEYLHEKIKSLTIFATHYHELSDLSAELPHCFNGSLAIQEWEGELVFLRRLEFKPAESSYGIYVAKLAGLPKGVIKKAEKLLAEHVLNSQRRELSAAQMNLFMATPKEVVESPAADPLREALDALKLDDLSPKEAWLALERLKEESQA